MRIVFMGLFMILTYCSLQAQNPYGFQKEHDAYLVKDLDKTADFYKNVLGLEEIVDSGFPKETHRWFLLGDGSQIHLIIADEVLPQPKGTHRCFNTTDLDGLMAHLKKHKVHFESWTGEEDVPTLRGDGVKQIYLQDPAGYWIEVNTNTR